MSVRLLATRIAKHGRYFLQSYCKRDIHTNILEQNQGRTRQKRYTGAPAVARPSGVKSAQSVGAIAKQALNASLQSTSGSQAAGHVSSGIFRFGQHARKLFIDNILNRVTTTYSQELRQQATRKLFYGDSAPFFALVGVSLASGAGVLTKEDELEGVCWEIREAANRLQNTWTSDEISDTLDAEFTINKLNIGPAIAKGCAAVVYAAAMKPDKATAEAAPESPADPVRAYQSPPIPVNRSPTHQPMLRAEMMSPMVNMSRFVHNFGGSLDNVNALYNQNSAAVAFVEDLKSREETPAETKRPEDGSQRTGLATTSGGVQQMESLNVPGVSLSRYPLALKMMFNYDIQSNAMAILRAMYKETVPARQRRMNEASEEWERLIQNQTLVLPPHPNVVCMYGFFCDEVGNFPDGHLLYPIAQPQRINPLGYGRNMSLYLLMKRYDHSLRSLLDTRELPTRWKLLLLTQLLEAVAHINRHGIAHRDLKSDNVLIEMSDDESPPVLVLSDFGCCLADKTNGLEVPYSSFDIDKGGNAALMAPEIINKQPGPFAVLNYHKSDLWACGALAYEIFGHRNPFYSSSGGVAWARGEQTYSLRNSDYKEEDLPSLTDECPAVVQQLIYNILQPNPGKRVSPDVAANVMQLFLWAPSQWLKPGGQPNSTEILQWLLSLTTKVISDGRFGSGPGNLNFSAPLSFQTNGRRTYVEYLLICSFLARARLRRIRGALNWIQNVVA